MDHLCILEGTSTCGTGDPATRFPQENQICESVDEIFPQFLDAPGHSFMFLCNEPRKAVGKLLWSVVWRTCFLPLCW